MKKLLNLRDTSLRSLSGLFLQEGIIHKLMESWSDSGTNMISIGGGSVRCRISWIGITAGYMAPSMAFVRKMPIAVLGLFFAWSE